MVDPLTISDAQAFEIERMSRAIDATTNVDALKQLCKQLLLAWMTQKAATAWVMRNPFPVYQHFTAPQQIQQKEITEE